MPTISGIPCDKSVVESFRKLHKMKSIRFVTYKIRRGPRSVVTTVDRISGSRSDTFEDMVQVTPVNEPRFLLFDFSYTPYDGNVEKVRPMFIYWCPAEDSRPDWRTMYSATKSTILKELYTVALVKSCEIMDKQDLTESTLLKILIPKRKSSLLDY